MKKEARLLLAKAVDSLLLSVEHFNRPWDRGRVDSVLILLDHAFEMFLKAGILHRGGRIREKGAKQTLGFDTCLRRALSDGAIKFIGDEQALVLQVINSLRDAAQHHLVEVSEPQLYLHAQSGLTLFRDLLKDVFARDLSEDMPARVLPVSTTAPTDLATLFDQQIKEIQKLLSPGARRRTEAGAKLRALAIMEGAVSGERLQPSEGDLKSLMTKVQKAASWRDLFPGVASLNLVAEGAGPAFSLRLTKKEGIPVQLVQEGTPGATVVAVKRVDELGYYSLGRDQIAKKIGLSGPKTTAAIRHLGIQADPDCYKEFIIGKAKFARYSPKALDRIKTGLEKQPIEEIWKHAAPRSKSARITPPQAPS